MAGLADFAVSAGSERSADSFGMSSEARARHCSAACFASLKSTAMVGCCLTDAAMIVVVVVAAVVAVV